MCSKLFIAIILTILNANVQAQQPLRRVFQPPKEINKIPYGSTSGTGEYVQAGDAKIYYEIYGKGQPIAVLHGGIFGSTIEMAPFID